MLRGMIFDLILAPGLVVARAVQTVVWRYKNAESAHQAWTRALKVESVHLSTQQPWTWLGYRQYYSHPFAQQPFLLLLAQVQTSLVMVQEGALLVSIL